MRKLCCFTLLLTILFTTSVQAGGISYGAGKIKKCLKEISTCIIKDNNSKNK